MFYIMHDLIDFYDLCYTKKSVSQKLKGNFLFFNVLNRHIRNNLKSEISI